MPAPARRRNVVVNPSWAVDLASTVYSRLAGSRSFEWAAQEAVDVSGDDASLELEVTALGGVTSVYTAGGAGVGGRHPVAPGQYVHARIRVQALRACAVRHAVAWYTGAAGAGISQPPAGLTVLAAGDVVLLERRNDAQAPAGVDGLFPIVYLNEPGGGNVAQLGPIARVDAWAAYVAGEQWPDPVPYLDSGLALPDWPGYTYDSNGPATLAGARVQLGFDAADVRDDPRVEELCAAVNARVRSWPIGVDARSLDAWPADARLGANMLVARLFRRKGSPAGVEAFGDQGALYVRRNDPDIAMLLQLGDYAMPRVG